MKPASVIIMDEHPIVRMSIEVLLKKNENIHVVLKTDDSRKTLEYLRSQPVDLVILDIELPRTDGFTLLKRIKKDTTRDQRAVSVVKVRILLCRARHPRRSKRFCQ